MIRIRCLPRVIDLTMTVILLAVLLSGTRLHAQSVSSPSAASGKTEQALRSGGIIAEEISRATGLAISPILGLSVLGAHTYYTTPVAERDRVPWYARPAFWGPLLAVLLGIILKDSAKLALPKVLVMPLDAVETLLEKNASAVLALLVILSSMTGRGIDQPHPAGLVPEISLPSAVHAAGNVSALSSPGLPGTGAFPLLLVLLFAVVWVAGQSLNFLVLLSPFSWLDLLLTGFKNSIVALLLGSYLLNPFLGLGVALVIIILSCFLFARSYRFIIFGTIFSTDILLKRSRRNPPAGEKIQAFSCSAVADIPPQSYGYLTAGETALVFRFRPWLILPPRTVQTPFAASRCEVGIGTVSSIILDPGTKDKSYRTLFRLRPLYSSHEQRVAETLDLKGVRDVTFGRTLRDGFAWLREQAGLPAEKIHEDV